MFLTLFKNDFFVYFAEHGSELDYIVGTILNDLTNRLKGSSSDIQLSDTAKTGVVIWWNYMDGLFDFMLALNQFTDTSNYRYRQNVIKGILNTVAAVQLYVFTYNPPLSKAMGMKGDTPLAGIVFAISTFTDFLCALFDFYNAYKETSILGWLDEKIKEVLFAHAKGHESKALVKDIRARSKAYVGKDLEKNNQLMTFFTEKFPNDTEHGFLFVKITSSLDTVRFKHRERDLDIQNEVNQVYRANRTSISMKGMSLTGMVLLAVASFVDLASNNYPIFMTLGLASTTLVASYYFILNAERIADKAGSMFHRFFQSNCSRTVTNEPKESLELPNLV